MSKVYAIFAPPQRRGIYSTWPECQSALAKCPKGRSFASFKTREDAMQALVCGSLLEYKRRKSAIEEQPWYKQPKLVETPCIVVDAACSGSPGPVEYRGVVLPDGFEVFRQGPYKNGTNNVGEFLAIYTGLKWLEERSLPFPLYSDSAVAITWVLRPVPRCRTSLIDNGTLGRELSELVPRAENWLSREASKKLAATRVRKWDTATLGEIPADFGRK